MRWVFSRANVGKRLYRKVSPVTNEDDNFFVIMVDFPLLFSDFYYSNSIINPYPKERIY